ncbi:MAG: heavy metal transporter [Gemmatimonadetes bacterium]|nr:heavy metal transporter [Gemmatimonadota bacterium]|tara:strand:+ start:974 stop:1201 length:228 start_codon:yes stop_codon:yes gene_type:complete
MFWSKKVKLEIRGMSCGHCEATVEEGLSTLTEVAKVKADHQLDQVTIRYKGECPSIEAVRSKVNELGFEAANSWA